MPTRDTHRTCDGKSLRKLNWNTLAFSNDPMRSCLCQTAPRSGRALTAWELVIMGLIDAIVDRSFRDSPSGRVVVFSGGPGKQGYLVRSATEEQKIRSFLKMFYFAHLYILVLGIMLSQAWASWLSQTLLGRPARHLLGAVSIALAIYGLVVGLPYAFLWRAYRRALTSFIPASP